MAVCNESWDAGKEDGEDEEDAEFGLVDGVVFAGEVEGEGV